MTETSSITNPLIRALNAIPGVKSGRANAGSPVFRYKGAEPGTPDIYGCANGRAFLIECKDPEGKTSKARAATQRRVQGEWAAAGAAVFPNVQSVAEGLALIRALMRSEVTQR